MISNYFKNSYRWRHHINKYHHNITTNVAKKIQHSIITGFEEKVKNIK
jgi:hypothetical protein